MKKIHFLLFSASLAMGSAANAQLQIEIAGVGSNQIPVAVALGFDDPAPNLMEHTPRPLKQPILSRGQWVRIAFIGILMAIATIYLEMVYEPVDATLARSVGFVVFSLLVVFTALSARSETASVFNRDIFHNRQQLMLYGVSLLMIVLPLQLDFLQKALGLVNLTGELWLQCIGFVVALLLVDEVIKFFLRRSRKSKVEVKVQAPQPV